MVITKHHVRRIHEHVVYNGLIIVLAILSASLLVFEVSADLFADQLRFMYLIDIIIATIFFLDFVIGFSVADDKKKYFKGNWIDLVAAIPIPGGTFQSLRILRVVRVLARIWKISKVAENISSGAAKYIYALSVVTSIILCGAISFFTFEYGNNSHIHGFFDAVWWTVVTVAGVGYGDIVPVTVEGRVVGIILMISGMCIVGAIAGLAGSYFIEKKFHRQA